LTSGVYEVVPAFAGALNAIALNNHVSPLIITSVHNLTYRLVDFYCTFFLINCQLFSLLLNQEVMSFENC
ncbi:MAG: hypothetical protein J6C85_02900, partial [Alphaproteobacteria bacterium]|nr:hypothetical protein [Alphaproteobacteria bacterium]